MPQQRFGTNDPTKSPTSHSMGLRQTRHGNADRIRPRQTSRTDSIFWGQHFKIDLVADQPDIIGPAELDNRLILLSTVDCADRVVG